MDRMGIKVPNVAMLLPPLSPQGFMPKIIEAESNQTLQSRRRQLHQRILLAITGDEGSQIPESPPQGLQGDP
jgi:hypothetical protein